MSYRIRAADAAELIGTSTYSLTEAIKNGDKGYEYGQYNKRKGCTRGHVVITPMLFARHLGISEDALKEKIDNLRQNHIVTLKQLLNLHQGGDTSISIHELPYNNNCYAKTYFEEEEQEEIEQSEVFETIKYRKVERFYIIGGDLYDTELIIELKASDDNL